MTIHRIHFFVGVYIALSTVGCNRSAPPSNTLIYGRSSDADTLDPIHTTSGETVKVLVNIYDTLVTYRELTPEEADQGKDPLELVPSLATDWSHGNDGRSWTFHLRQGVKFHDGTPFNADAVLFSLNRLLKHGNPVPPHRPQFSLIEDITKEDEFTVVFTLREPSPIFLHKLAMFPAAIVSPTAAKKEGSEFGMQPVGTGPFRFQNWDRGETIRLTAFDDHWRDRPKIDRLIFRAIGENTSRADRLRRGDVHIADNLPPSTLDGLAGHDNIIIQERPGLNTGYLSINCERPPLNNVKIRRAIWHAIDKAHLIQLAYGGKAEAAVSVVPTEMWGHADHLVDRPYDVDEAIRLLHEGAAEESFTLPLKVRLFTMNQARPYLQQPRISALYIRDALLEIGIEAEIVQGNVPEYFQRLSRGEHDLGLIGWSPDYVDPHTFLFSLLDPDSISDAGGNNVCRYRNAKLHDLLGQAELELDVERRLALYHEVQQIVFDEVPLVPLVHAEIRVAQRAELKGYYLHPASMERVRLSFFRETAP